MSYRRTVLYEAQSNYGNYKVVDMRYNDRPARVLFGDGRSPQSGMAHDDNPALLFSYNQRFLEMIMSVRPKHLLVIGGGVGMLPTAAFHMFPTMTVDVVEIDSTLVSIAREYFNLPDDSRFRVHIQDGKEFIASTRRKFDMIIIDAFSGYTIPPHLIEYEALTHYQRCLKRGGVVAINFISEYSARRRRLAHDLIASWREVFQTVAMYQADPDYEAAPDQNRVLVGSRKPVAFDYLQAEATPLLDDI